MQKYGMLFISFVIVILIVFNNASSAQSAFKTEGDLVFSSQFQRYYHSVKENRSDYLPGSNRGEAAVSQGSWESLSFSGGDVNSVLISSSGDIFAATYTGVFRSEDNGANWEDINVNLGNGTAICLAENSAGQIFLANIDGIYRSDDNGDTWTVNPILGEGQSFESVYAAANDFIYAGTFTSSLGNMFLSTNSGGSWEEISVPSATAVTAIYAVNDTTVLAGGFFSGIHISTDNGSSWLSTNISEGYFRQFAGNPGGDIFADGFSISGNITGVYRSTDRGMNWVRLSSGFEYLNVKGIAVNNNDDIFVGVTGSKEIYYSSDNGNTWDNITHDLNLHFGTHWLAATDSSVFVASVGEGVFRSTDYGNNWTEGEGLHAYKVTAIDAGSPFNLLAGGTAGGIYHSTDDGENWSRLNLGLTSPVINSIVTNEAGDIFAGTQAGGIYISTNNGNNWLQINSGLPNGNSGSIYAIVIDTSGGSQAIYVSTGDSFYRSTNNGESWEPYYTGLAGMIFKAAANQKGQVFAGTDFFGMYRSESGSGTWIPINSGLQNPLLPVTGIAFCSPDTIFCSMGATGVYRSSDTGDNWTLTSLDDPAITDLTSDSKGDIFAGSGYYTVPPSNDVYRSVDNGTNWESIAGNLGSNSPVTAVSVDFRDRLLAGTWNNGLYRWDGGTTEVSGEREDLPSGYELFQNYPNPFNPVTTIEYSIPEDGFVNLAIFNVLGQLAANLVSENMRAGKYHLTFNASKLASGVYYYRMETNNKVFVKKMLLLK